MTNQTHVNIPMTPELAQQFVDRRKLKPKETWKDYVGVISPTLNPLSVKAYVSKYINGKLGNQKNGGDKKIIPRDDLQYGILLVRWY